MTGKQLKNRYSSSNPGKRQKNAAIQVAEGQKQAAILQAEGQKTATIEIAEGDAQATKLRNEALTTYFKDSAIVFKQLDTITSSLQNTQKLLFPKAKQYH